MDDYTRDIMTKYTRAVVHMREQIELRRFGLVFGAGLSEGFGFPSWQELVELIAADERVDGKHILNKARSKTSVSQLLFQNYRAKELQSLSEGFDRYDRLCSHIQSGWHKIIHDALYKNVPSELSEIKARDKYLHEYLSIIKGTKLTVNYNFDDTLQTLLSEHKPLTQDANGRGFRTICSADIQLYPQNGVIYHPNGFLPRNFEERPSDDLIFLEGDFGDQLLESASGHYMALSYHFSQSTCLFVGLSLDDSTLKHLLRKNAILHPGHVHYYIHFLEDGDSLDEEHRNAIRDANFAVYNLVTLFLDGKGIAKLGQLLSMGDDKDIEIFADELGVPSVYRFFLTGSVSVGKSTAISHFRSLRTHDEWLDKRAPRMGDAPSMVKDSAAIKLIDEFVAHQWRRKNFLLSNARHGIHIIDRCPLDALVFTPEDKWVAKAIFTRMTITPDRSKTGLCRGKVILMIGDPKVMEVRAMKLQKNMPSESLEHMQGLFRVLYNHDSLGIVEVDTCNKSVRGVVKEICRIIHIGDYEDCDLQERLNLVEAGRVLPAKISGNT